MAFFNAIKKLSSPLLFKPPHLFKSSVKNQMILSHSSLPILVSNLSNGCFSLSLTTHLFKTSASVSVSGVRLFNTETSINDEDDLICCYPECGCYCRCQCQKMIPKDLRKGKGSAEGCRGECKEMDKKWVLKEGRDKGKLWETREDEKAFYMRIKCPGIGQQHFSITLKGGGYIFMKGEAPNEPAGAGEPYIIYSGTLHLSPSKYDLHSITYLVKNGVANILVPKKISDGPPDVKKYINID